MEKREHWGSKWGFILAAMGSAVGLGNIWRFSYAMGSGGGAAFLIIYLVSVLLIGFPVMMVEFAIGSRAQTDAVGAFKKLAPGTAWKGVGVLGVIAGFVILSFYGVIGGWSIRYVVEYLTGGVAGDTEAFFGGFISQAGEPIIYQVIFMALTIGIVYFGVQKGIEWSSKWIMPFLSVLLVLLAIYSLTLGGAGEAMEFMFRPDWSSFTDPDVYVGAIGQAFFTLSLGMGAMLTYASYLHPDERLTSSAGVIILLDTAFAIVCGLVIFPALFAFGLNPAEGAGLVFVVLPVVFQQLGTVGTIVGAVFFLLVVLSAISSAISLLEVTVAFFINKFNWNRRLTTVVFGGIITLVGIPSSLSQGAMDITVFGDSFLDLMDKFTERLLLPLGGLLMVIFVAWTWGKDEILKYADINDAAWGPAFLFVTKWIVPVGMAIVLIFSLLGWNG